MRMNKEFDWMLPLQPFQNTNTVCSVSVTCMMSQVKKRRRRALHTPTETTDASQYDENTSSVTLQPKPVNHGIRNVDLNRPLLHRLQPLLTKPCQNQTVPHVEKVGDYDSTLKTMEAPDLMENDLTSNQSAETVSVTDQDRQSSSVPSEVSTPLSISLKHVDSPMQGDSSAVNSDFEKSDNFDRAFLMDTSQSSQRSSSLGVVSDQLVETVSIASNDDNDSSADYQSVDSSPVMEVELSSKDSVVQDEVILTADPDGRTQESMEPTSDTIDNDNSQSSVVSLTLRRKRKKELGVTPNKRRRVSVEGEDSLSITFTPSEKEIRHGYGLDVEPTSQPDLPEDEVVSVQTVSTDPSPRSQHPDPETESVTGRDIVDSNPQTVLDTQSSNEDDILLDCQIISLPESVPAAAELERDTSANKEDLGPPTVTVDTLSLPFDEVDQSSMSQSSATVSTAPAKKKRGRAKGRRSQIFVKEVKKENPPPTVQEEPMVTVDTLELPFDEEDAQSVVETQKKVLVTNRRGKKLKANEPEPVTVDDLQLPFDDVAEKTPPKVAKPKKRRGRRSSDFEVLNSSNVLSPGTSESPGAESYMPMGHASVRRSGRIRRKSLEIYRAASRKKQQEEVKEETVEEEASIVCPEEPKESPKSPVKSLDLCDLAEEPTPLMTEENLVIEIQVDQTPEKCTAKEQEDTTITRRVRRKTVEAKEAEEKEKPAQKPRAKKSKKNTKADESVEDIYLNKLWRTQMPQEKTWEMIFEEPKKTFQSAKKYRTKINFDDFYAKNRLKKRRQKALKQGWKPFTVKQDKRATALLDKKLASLEEALSVVSEDECDSVSAHTSDVQGTPELPSTSSLTTEDIFYTPKASLMDMVPCTDSVDTRTDQDAMSVSSASSSVCDYQMFKTPLKDLLEEAEHDMGFV